MRRKVWRWAIVVVVLAAAVVAAWQIWLARSSGEPAQRDARGRAGMITATFRVSRGDIRSVVQASGYLEPVTQQSLYFSTSGQVEEVLVEPGDRVTKGQVLARISNSQAELSLLQARNAYERSRLEDPPATIQEKRMQWELAQKTVDGMTLRAPFDGVVGAVNISRGDQVDGKTAAITVFEPGKFQVETDVGEADIEKIQVGQTAEVKVTAYPDLVLEGRVSRVALIAKNQNGVVTIPVTVEVASADSRLRSGLGADVNIIIASAQNVLRVPIEAVAPDPQGRYYATKVTDDGQQQAVPVEIGATDGLWVEIKTGLAEGERVLTNNFALYRNLMAQEAQNQQGGQGRSGFFPGFMQGLPPGMEGQPPGIEGTTRSNQSNPSQQGTQEGARWQQEGAPSGSPAMSTLRTFRSLERMVSPGGGANAGGGF
ncbi:MAG TPA: efflux RND transporter periplasmic adaptor subunit [Firmicutes bacterium]|nr:efflux RND transporter periplasmic adaptor subunit [Bacillota bacterium]